VNSNFLISFISSLLQHHQRRWDRSLLLLEELAVLQAREAETLSKEKQLLHHPQQRREAIVRQELDPVECGVSTQTTVPESKCK
jgi:hypothetical protein